MLMKFFNDFLTFLTTVAQNCQNSFFILYQHAGVNNRAKMRQVSGLIVVA